MNVKSKYDTDESESERTRVERVRGMCGTPFEMFQGPARVDVSGVKGPKFLQKIFRALGWKTKTEQSR